MIKAAVKSLLAVLGYTMQRTATVDGTQNSSAQKVEHLEQLLAKAHQDLARGGLTAPFNCPACGESEAFKVLTGHYGDLVKCSNCRSQMIWPLPSSEELSAIYSARNVYTDIGDGDIERYVADPSVKVWHAGYIRDILKKLNQPKNATVIEIGCMHGLVMLELERLGYNCYGIDPSPDGIKYLNDSGGRGYCGTLMDEEMPFKQADAFVTFHALEHMPNPYATLKRMHEILPVGGVLHFSIPHWGGLVAQKQLDQWKWFCPPYHLHYFTEEALLPVLQKIGFQVVDTYGTAGDYEVDEILAAYEPKGGMDATERAAAVQLMRKLRLADGIEVTAVRMADQ